MPLSPRDARRMVAKSRRRVWRLCRAHGLGPSATVPAWETPNSRATWVLGALLTHCAWHDPAVRALRAEWRERYDAMRLVEIAGHDAPALRALREVAKERLRHAH